MQAKVISVISGKGGTGKSTVSGGLAVTLAESGAEVLVIDLDIGLRALDIMLGLENAIIYDIGDVQAGRCPVEKAVVAHRIFPNMKLLCAPMHIGEKFDVRQLIDLIASCKGGYEYIIMDLPAGLGLGVMLTRALADLCIAVTTTDEVTMRDSKKICDVITKGKEIEIVLIVNKVSKISMKTGGVEDIDEVMDTIGAPLLGILADDEWIKSILNPGKKQHPANKQTAKAFQAISRRIQGQYVPLVIKSL